MRFSEPLYLLLLIPATLGLVLSFRQVHGMARGRKRLAFAVRFALAALLIGALAGPESYRPNEGLGIVFLLDRSDSIDDAGKAQAERFVDGALRSLGTSDAAAVVAFGRDALVDSAPGGRRALTKVASKVQPDASDIAQAIRLGSAALPEGKARRLVVLSDGNETAGDAMGAAQVAATDQVSLDYVALGHKATAAEASVIDLHAPSDARADNPFELRAEVDSTVTQRATIQLDRNGVIIKQVPVTLNPGRNAVVISDRLRSPGFHRYRATVLAGYDRDNRNNQGQAFVAVRGRPKVLVLQEDPSKTQIAQAMRRGGVEVELGGPGRVPSRAEDLQEYDALVFNDLNADSVTEAQMKLVQAAVRDSGIGFMMVGGENSYLPGGYFGTPIAEVLPVDLNIRQRKVFPSTSVLIVVDCSGSMWMPEDGVIKLELAKKAAEQTVKLLSSRDRLGVAGSTDGIEFAAPMQKLTNKGAVIAQIRKLDSSGGGIYVEPSMKFATEALNRESTQVRHLILLADGADADMHGASLRIASAMRANKITTSVVAIGDGKDVPFLKELARAGGGRFYLATKAKQLPAIFTQDTSIMSRSAIEEGAFYPRMTTGEPILKGIDATPPLLAYCLAEARPLASVGMRTHKDDPLLATWQYGLGNSIAFTSDAQARWAAQWVGWEGFSAFWSQAARAILRRATLGQYQVRVRQEGGKGLVEIAASDALGYPIKLMTSEVRVSMPDGTSQPIEVAQDAPGRFKGSFEASQIGSYIVTVAEPDPQGGTHVRSSGFSIAYPPEYRNFRANLPLLERMAAVSGGKALARPEEAVRPMKDPGASIAELWQWFVLAAALLLPFDVAVRRIALPLAEILAKALERVRLRQAARRTVPEVVVVDRLQAAKQRARQESAPSSSPPAARPAEQPATERQPERREPAAAAPGGSTSERLLAAKRQRKGD